MPTSKTPPTPQFYVSDGHKDAMAGQFAAQAIFSIERLALKENPDLEADFLIADDFVDIVARVAAAMIAADTNFDTPAKLRLGAETFASHVLRHAKRYREEQAETGVATLHRMLGENEIPDEMKRHWNNS